MKKFVAVPLSIVTAILTLTAIMAGLLGFVWCMVQIGTGIGFLIGLSPEIFKLVTVSILLVGFLCALIADIARVQYRYFKTK
jgi:hypothetical protein